MENRMNERKYVVGVDYGTLSARAVLLDTADGRELATAECVYAHGIMTEREISGGEPKPTTALQHPSDYLEALSVTVKGVLLKAGVMPESVVGLCIDATASTILPYLNDGTPLASQEGFEENAEAYIKLWKHHGAEHIAERMTAAAKERGEEWLSDYGNTVSAEWFFPKLAEIAASSPEAYASADVVAEAAEWLVERITGERVKSACFAGYKSLWSTISGYPSAEYFSAACPELDGVFSKLGDRVLPLGSIAGRINEAGEAITGLKEGTVVATPVIDAHAALPSAKVTSDGELMIIFGTSACHILLSKENKPIKGICGKVDGGVVPGYYAYEAGQPCVGDMLAWFVENCLPERYTAEAKRQGVTIFDYLNSLAEGLEVGKSGLVALDWWNGNRSPYVDYNLSGMLVGLTMHTRPEEIYAALIASIAFGTRQLVELFDDGGIAVRRIVAGGGIAVKNRYFMETVADVLGREIFVSETKQTGAKGSAIYAAVAAGCYPSVGEAAEAMGDDCRTSYKPNPDKRGAYDKLYQIYLELSQHFAASDIMKRLREI